jgi:ribosome-associated protein
MSNNHDNDDFDDIDDDDIEDADDNQYSGPSKSQRKRDAEALQKLGEDLISLKNSDLAQFDLPDTLLKALRDARTITSHGGLKRQHQYIGKIMRSIDAEAISKKMEELRHRHELNSGHFKKLEHWRDRILAEGNKAIDELMEEYPQGDRQQLRQLHRNSVKEQAAGKPPAAARQLFRYLRQLAENG